jgi:hypothetical protein
MEIAYIVAMCIVAVVAIVVNRSTKKYPPAKVRVIFIPNL